ncbi:hypothetical protein GEMRC1_001467 [Eukaryota sp. GEM-RC1]
MVDNDLYITDVPVELLKSSSIVCGDPGIRDQLMMGARRKYGPPKIQNSKPKEPSYTKLEWEEWRNDNGKSGNSGYHKRLNNERRRKAKGRAASYRTTNLEPPKDPPPEKPGIKKELKKFHFKRLTAPQRNRETPGKDQQKFFRESKKSWIIGGKTNEEWEKQLSKHSSKGLDHDDFLAYCKALSMNSL